MWRFNIISRRRREKRVIAALRAGGELSSLEICYAARLRGGTLYDTLGRMEHSGRIVSRWGEATEGRDWYRPRLYRLT